MSSLPCYNKRMKYEIIRTETMRLVGFAARTNNGAPDCGAVIGSLWQKYFEAFGYACASYCVYTDYAGDETDDYTAFVGCEGDALPSGGRAVEIPAGLYVAFSLACTTENAPRAVAQFWQKLWTGGLPRAFVADFEEYGAEGVRVFIRVNEEDLETWRQTIGS